MNISGHILTGLPTVRRNPKPGPPALKRCVSVATPGARSAVGSVIGIDGTVGGIIMAKYAGFVLDSIGSYKPLFAVAGSAYFLAHGAEHLLSPRLPRGG